MKIPRYPTAELTLKCITMVKASNMFAKEQQNSSTA